MNKKLNCVLLIDDNEYDNFFHKRVITKADITDHIEIAENGKEALDFLTSKLCTGQSESSFCQPELVFLDINMPVMDGWQFLEEYTKCQEIQKGKTIFIILTTSVNPADRIKAEKMFGSDCFQGKPMTLEMLNNIIQKYFTGNL